MASEIGRVDATRLLNTSVEDLANFFAEKFKITVPMLMEDEIVVDSREKQIDVSRDSMRMIIDRDRSFYVTGTEVEVEVPFTGEADALKIRPTQSSLNPPRATVRGGKLIFSIVGTSLDSTGVGIEIKHVVS
jgi:hypothetical protein